MKTKKQELQHQRLLMAWCEVDKLEMSTRRKEGASNMTFVMLDMGKSAIEHVAAITRAAVEGRDDLPDYDELSEQLVRELDEVFMRHVNASAALRQN